MNNSKQVLVAGATGYLGTEICKQLVANGQSVKALVRSVSDPSKVKMLQDLGVETVTGDLKEPVSLDSALNGVSSVISTVSSTLSHTEGDNIESVDRQGQQNLIEAAGKAGVEKFVFISFKESPETFPLQDAKREAEQKLMESKMNYTIIRAGFFMEIWLGPHLGFDPANRKATIYGHGVNPVSWVAIKDVAAFAVASLDHASATNAILEVGGPESFSPLETVRIFEEKTGQPFTLQYIPLEGLRTQYEVSSDPLQKSFAALMLTLSHGSTIDMTENLEAFPIKMQTVKEYANLVLSQEETLTEA